MANCKLATCDRYPCFHSMTPEEQLYEFARIDEEYSRNELAEKDYAFIFQEQDKQIALLKAHDPAGMIDWDTFALGIDGLPIPADDLRDGMSRRYEDEALRMLIALNKGLPYEPRLQYCLTCGCPVKLTPVRPEPPIQIKKIKKPGVELW